MSEASESGSHFWPLPRRAARWQTVATTWIILGVVLIAVLIAVLVMFRYPLFMPNLRKDMTREEIARELQNMRNLGADLDAKKGLRGDQDLWRHVPGAP